MFQTLGIRDDTLVDGSDAGRTPIGGIFFLRQGDALTVKRLSVHPSNRTLNSSSDNAAYQAWAHWKPDSVNVIGCLAWVGYRQPRELTSASAAAAVSFEIDASRRLA